MKNAPLRHRLEYAAFWPFARLLRLLPHAASRALGGAVGGAAGRLDRRRRRIGRANLAAALPELPAREREAILERCFRHFGAVFADALSAARFDAVELCHRVTLAGIEHLVAAEDQGRGVIVLSAHFGNWEVVPPLVALARGPMASVGRPADNPWVEREIQVLRGRLGNRAVPKRGAVRELFRLLAGGGRVGLLIDQRVRAEEGIDVPFFGRPAWTSPIVARLALRTGAAIVPAFGDHLPGGRYRVEFLPALAARGVDDAATTFELTRRCLAVCEQVVRRAPERWLWLHDRWKH
jgi:KDO2-lipid IV(A) lauroyltransferase